MPDWPAEFRQNISSTPPRADRSRASSPTEKPTDAPPPARADRSKPVRQAAPGHRSFRCNLHTELSRGLDAKIKRGASLKVVRLGPPFASSVRRHGPVPYQRRLMKRVVELIQESSQQAAELFTALASDGSADMRVAESIARDGLSAAADDIDLFVCLGLTPTTSGYPSKHALKVAMLAMCIGVAMGWDRQTLLDLGIGCLLHDVGMLGVEHGTYDRKRILAPSDFEEVTRHPVYTIEWLRRHFDGIPPTAQMVCYQMHERCDGSGYPRGYTGRQIHELAKVAAVADVFVALLSPRPHRPAMLPHDALRKILLDTRDGAYDGEAVRGLLHTVSLFPIGSYVAFNDGRVGRVIRATGQTYDRPIVEVCKDNQQFTDHTVVDLSGTDDLKITRTLARLTDA
jgi:HD-GYP domain-containing protein (c-di-GMP phosphodiesterase class II)